MSVSLGFGPKNPNKEGIGIGSPLLDPPQDPRSASPHPQYHSLEQGRDDGTGAKQGPGLGQGAGRGVGVTAAALGKRDRREGGRKGPRGLPGTPAVTGLVGGPGKTAKDTGA